MFHMKDMIFVVCFQYITICVFIVFNISHIIIVVFVWLIWSRINMIFSLYYLCSYRLPVRRILLSIGPITFKFYNSFYGSIRRQIYCFIIFVISIGTGSFQNNVVFTCLDYLCILRRVKFNYNIQFLCVSLFKSSPVINGTIANRPVCTQRIIADKALIHNCVVFFNLMTCQTLQLTQIVQIFRCMNQANL